jgi:hypothetical protein
MIFACARACENDYLGLSFITSRLFHEFFHQRARSDWWPFIIMLISVFVIMGAFMGRRIHPRLLVRIFG